MRNLLLFFVILWGVTASPIALAQHCVSGRYGEQTIFDETQIEAISNIPYATVTHTFTGQELQLELDVWAPSADVDPVAQRPLVILIHGGSFLAGNRSEMNGYCLEFARRGYVAATITYRLGWDCDPNVGLGACLLCQAQAGKLRTAVYNAIQDANAAARFLYHNADSYGIDPETFFIGGVSAGSITALGAAYLSQEEANAFAPNGLALSGGLFSSGNSFANLHSFTAVMNQCGAVPATSVLDDAIPVISFHDDGDCVVPYNNGHVLGCLGCTTFATVAGSASLHNALAANGVCTELNTQQLSLLHCSWPVGNAVRRSACFFKRTMCGVCTSSTNTSNTLASPCMELGILCESGEPTCTSDLNNDGIVNAGDLTIFLTEFGTFCQ